MNIIKYIPVTISVVILFVVTTYWIVCIIRNKKGKTYNYNNKKNNIKDFFCYMWVLILTAIFLIIFSIMRSEDIQITLPIIVSVISLCVSIANFVYNKENLSIGEVNFDKAEISDIKMGSENTIFTVTLIDSHQQLNFGHYIKSEKISVWFYYNKTIFEHEEYLEKIGDENSDYYISFNVDDDSIDKEKTKFINDSLRFSFDVVDHGSKTKNIFNKDCFYDDTNMLVVEINYKIKRPKSIASFFNIKEKVYTQKLHYLFQTCESQKYKYISRFD